MTTYRVIVASEDQMVYTSPLLNGFEAAREMLVTQLLDTAENDWAVQAEEIDAVVSKAEVLTLEEATVPVFLGNYVHIILEEKLDN
jgi:hypothetical protein